MGCLPKQNQDFIRTTESLRCGKDIGETLRLPARCINCCWMKQQKCPLRLIAEIPETLLKQWQFFPGRTNVRRMEERRKRPVGNVWVMWTGWQIPGTTVLTVCWWGGKGGRTNKWRGSFFPATERMSGRSLIDEEEMVSAAHWLHAQQDKMSLQKSKLLRFWGYNLWNQSLNSNVQL